MDFKQLEVFVCVAKYKSFSKAATNLFLTQPTVSSHIQKLEKELNTTLFERSNKSISLTPSGKILYDNAIIILNNCKKALSDLNDYSNKIDGLIHIGTSSVPETYILPSFINYFHSFYPDVKYNLSHYNSLDVVSEVLDEKIDFGFIGFKPNNNKIKCLDLIEDELVFICSGDISIPNTNGFIDIDKILNFDFIIRKSGSGTHNLMTSSLADNNINIDSLNIIAHVDSNESIKEMVSTGLGVSFISYISAIDYIKSNKINFYRIKENTFKRNFYFIYSKNKFFSPLEQSFFNSVLEFFNIS